MSIDEKALNRIKELEIIYSNTYGKDVDYGIIPAGATQNRIVECLKLMISDNLSLVVAYSKLYNS